MEAIWCACTWMHTLHTGEQLRWSRSACGSVTRISQQNSQCKLSATSCLIRKEQMRPSSNSWRRAHIHKSRSSWGPLTTLRTAGAPQSTSNSQNTNSSGPHHHMLGANWPKAALQKRVLESKRLIMNQQWQCAFLQDGSVSILESIKKRVASWVR